MRDGAHAKARSNARDRVRKGQGQAPKTESFVCAWAGGCATVHAKVRSNAARDRVRKGQAPKTRKIMEGLDANPYTTKSDAYRDTTHDFAGIRTRDPTSPRRGVLHREPQCN